MAVENLNKIIKGLKSKSIIYMIVLSFFMSCNNFNNNSHNKPLVYIKKSNNCSNCADCIYLSKSLVNNSEDNKILREYIYYSMIGGYECSRKNHFDEIFKKNFFLKVILLFYTDDRIKEISSIEPEDWGENREELLINCSNDSVLYRISDTLLSLGFFDGVEALWDKININKLNYFEDYFNKNKDNWFFLSSVVTIYHNSNMYTKRDSLLILLSENNDFSIEFNNLQNLLNNNKHISLIDYKESIYGGV